MAVSRVWASHVSRTPKSISPAAKVAYASTCRQAEDDRPLAGSKGLGMRTYGGWRKSCTTWDPQSTVIANIVSLFVQMLQELWRPAMGMERVLRDYGFWSVYCSL